MLVGEGQINSSCTGIGDIIINVIIFSIINIIGGEKWVFKKKFWGYRKVSKIIVTFGK